MINESHSWNRTASTEPGNLRYKCSLCNHEVSVPKKTATPDLLEEMCRDKKCVEMVFKRGSRIAAVFGARTR